MIKKAILLAAGRGTRMGALTESTPKPMALVQGKPVLEHILTGLRDESGVRDFFIVTGHLAHVIEDYFSDGSRWEIRCSYGRQIALDGTGKAPELAKTWLGSGKEPFFLTYGDILIDPKDYGEMSHGMQDGVDGMIALRQNEDLQQGGAVLLDENFYLTQIIEKSKDPLPVGQVAWLNAGVYILPTSLFHYTEKLALSPRGEYELTDALSAMAQDGLKIKGHAIVRRWADVRDPQVLQSLNQEKGETETTTM